MNDHDKTMISFPNVAKRAQDGMFTLDSYRVIDLRHLLRQKQQSPTGSKQELIERLLESLTKDEMYEMLIYNERNAARAMTREQLTHLLTHPPSIKASSTKSPPPSVQSISQAMRVKNRHQQAKQSRITTPKSQSWVSASKPTSDRSSQLSIGYRKDDVERIARTLNVCSITTETQARQLVKTLCDVYPHFVRCVPRKLRASKVASNEVGFIIPPPPPPPKVTAGKKLLHTPLDLQKGRYNLHSPKKIKVCLPGEVLKGGVCVRVQGPIGVDVRKMLHSGLAKIRKDMVENDDGGDEGGEDGEKWD